jgi:integrase/recombinase XerD
MDLVPRQMILFFKYIDETSAKLLRCQSDKLIITKLGKPISVDSVHAMIEPLKSLFTDRKLNPQTIRMSVICNWLNEKKFPLEKVQQLAGHKWPGTTEKYIKVNSLQQREMINRYFPSLYRHEIN